MKINIFQFVRYNSNISDIHVCVSVTNCLPLKVSQGTKRSRQNHFSFRRKVKLMLTSTKVCLLTETDDTQKELCSKEANIHFKISVNVCFKSQHFNVSCVLTVLIHFPNFCSNLNVTSESNN